MTDARGLGGPCVPVRRPVDTFGGMNGWIALSLTLLLGQTPAPPATPAPPTEQEAEDAVHRAELEELRARMDLLRTQTEAQQQEDQNRIQSLEQQQVTQSARSQQLEQMRRQHLESLSRGYNWIITADQLLESGDFDVGPALVNARQELSTALATAVDAGRGESTRLVQSALNRLSAVDDYIAQRNSYQARLVLQDAGFDLHFAWQISLNRSGATLVTQ